MMNDEGEAAFTDGADGREDSHSDAVAAVAEAVSNRANHNNDLLGTFCYIELLSLGSPGCSSRRAIPWPGLLVSGDGDHLAEFPQHIERRIIGVNVRRLYKEMVLLLANQRYTADGIPDGYDREVCNRYGAIYLFGDTPTGWSIGRFDATKIIADEKGLSFDDACEKYREFDGYVEACEKAQWYVEGNDDTTPGPPSHKRHTTSAEVTGYDAEREENDDDDSGGSSSSDDADNESDEDNGVPVPGALKADCIYVKGQLDRTRKHPGNLRFRRLLIKYARSYRSAKSKSSIIEKLIDEFEQEGGRFVKLEERLVGTDLSASISRDSWLELESKAKRKKVQDAFKNMRVGSQRDIEREENRKRSIVQINQRKEKTKRQKRSDMQEQSSDSSVDDTSVPDEESSVEEIRNVGKPLSRPRLVDCVSSYGWSDHPGNHRFHSIIGKFARKYREANREEKSSITTQVMARFGAEKRARFLRPSKEEGETLWVDLTRSSVRDKIGKALLEHDIESGSDEDSSDTSSDEDDDVSVIDELTKNDCVCVKNVGRTWGNHPGNRKFNATIAQYHDEYSHADPTRLKEISLEVEEELRQYGGRFLRPSEGSEPGSWVELTNAQIRKKINGAFRRYDPSIEKGKFRSDDSDDDDDQSKKEISSDSSDNDGCSESQYMQGSGKAKPNKSDCVVGNTSTPMPLDGNRVFESLVSKFGPGYLIALQDNNVVEKRRLRKKVFVEFRKTGGRFIREEGGGVFGLVGQRAIDDKIRRGLDRQAKQRQSEQPQSSRQKQTKTNLDANDSLLSDDGADLPFFKQLIRDGDSNFFYKAFRYSHIELIPSFADVRDTLEKAGHTFTDGTFRMPNDKTFTSEIEYRKEMCKNGVPVKGVRPRKCHDDPSMQIVMAWVSIACLLDGYN